ncbi:MAG: tRNA dihydrouridine(20/20a) synthase DusA [Pseudomonadota bacterium]
MNIVPLAVAPMMDWTDRHCRYFHRLLAPSAVLYTEMVTAAALVHGDAGRLLAFNTEEHPVVLQVGGSEPELMRTAAKLAEQAGYDAVNINIGCPSDRVQKGAFGACLMAEPDTVSQCWQAMAEAVSIPVTVKSRIGIDDRDDAAFLDAFVDAVAGAGCTHFDIHARIAILAGLSPKQNREVPPLIYDAVYRQKQRRPDLTVFINGGIVDADAAAAHLQHVDGVMIGRAAYQDPWSLVAFEQLANPDYTPPARATVVHEMADYVERALGQGASLKHVTRHMLGLFNGLPGARAWRRTLSERAHLDGVGPELLLAALEPLESVGA